MRARRYEQLTASMDSAAGGVSSLISSQFIDILLSVFLFVWFICGNYWVLSVWRPNYRQTLAEPNSWCDKTTYLLAAVQLCVCLVVVRQDHLSASRRPAVSLLRTDDIHRRRHCPARHPTASVDQSSVGLRYSNSASVQSEQFFHFY